MIRADQKQTHHQPGKKGVQTTEGASSRALASRWHLRSEASPSHTATPLGLLPPLAACVFRAASPPLSLCGSLPLQWPAPGSRRRPRRLRRRRRPSLTRCCWPRSAWWVCPWRCGSATDPPTPASSTLPASTPDTVSALIFLSPLTSAASRWVPPAGLGITGKPSWK